MASNLQLYNTNSNLQKWSVLVKECRSSGLSAKEWCKGKGFSANTYCRTSSFIVPVQDYLPLFMGSCHKQPHVTLGFRLSSFLVHHPYRCFICMQDLAGKQSPSQFLIYRSQISPRTGKQPVAHHLSIKFQALPVPFLFLPVKRRVHNILLVRYLNNSFWTCKTFGDKRWPLCCFGYRCIDSFFLVFHTRGCIEPAFTYPL